MCVRQFPLFAKGNTSSTSRYAAATAVATAHHLTIRWMKPPCTALRLNPQPTDSSFSSLTLLDSTGGPRVNRLRATAANRFAGTEASGSHCARK